MIYKRKSPAIISLLLLSLFLGLASGTSSTGGTTPSSGTSTGGTGATGTGSTTDASTTDPPTTPYQDFTETNNAKWLIIAIVIGVVVVFAAVIGACVAYAIHKNKKVHPHSDTESFYSESESESKTRPTTASHIHLDPDEDEAMSKPVTMTPFELRKLYIETFPYSKWKKGFDGSLRPHMGLKFVPPNMYKKTKGDEAHFREKIYNFENSDTLTLRSSALSRMMRYSTMPSTREEPGMEPVPEDGQYEEYHHQAPPMAHDFITPRTQKQMQTPRTQHSVMFANEQEQPNDDDLDLF